MVTGDVQKFGHVGPVSAICERTDPETDIQTR